MVRALFKLRYLHVPHAKERYFLISLGQFAMFVAGVIVKTLLHSQTTD